VKCEIEDPGYVLVMDPTLVDAVDVTSGVIEDGIIIVNSSRSSEELALGEGFRTFAFDGTTLAVDHGLGTRTAPIVNTAMLGVFAKISGLVGIDALANSIQKYFPRDKDGKNAKVARAAFEAAPAA
jgi:2-oxoacid:acceptor oxidoreductase gamma subunit (pyruvate/2-ketoisovalerate family)